MDKLKALNTYIETTKREILEGKNISPHTTQHLGGKGASGSDYRDIESIRVPDF